MSYIPSFVLLLMWWYWSAEGIYSGLSKFPMRWDRKFQYKSWQLLNMLFKASYWNWVLFLDGWMSSLISLNPTICFLDVLRRKWRLCTVLLCGLSAVSRQNCMEMFTSKASDWFWFLLLPHLQQSPLNLQEWIRNHLTFGLG